MRWTRTGTNRKAEAIVESARRHLGYRAQPERVSALQIAGYQGQPWNGTYIDRVLHDAFGVFAEVRFLSTVTALGYYAERNLLYRKPRVGDIVFYNFSADPLRAFEQPHVGVVTEVLPDGRFRAVEGETSPGTPQGSQLVDGVFERTRFSADILAVVRPTPATELKRAEPSGKVRMSYFESNPKTRSRAVEHIQRAIQRVLTFQLTRGKLDTATRSTLGVYARRNGWVRNRGEIEHGVIQHLADQTGEFEVE
ncbi:endolysin [Microbacterium phage Cece]|nr:endolysin [Microbacterium phage Cece]UVG35315.1 endolysin [Microbacterium phage Cece]